MLRNFIKAVVEVYRWRWLNDEDLFEGISNVTIRTMVTALLFTVQFAISDVLFGWLWVALCFSKRFLQWYSENIISENIERYDTVLSWEEES